MLFFMRNFGCPTISLKSRGHVSYASKLIYIKVKRKVSHPKYLSIEK